MSSALTKIVMFIARIHSKILRWNDAHEYEFSDKDLHFLVIGVLGMVMIFVIYPIFLYLAKKKLTMIITWLYVFTVLIGLTFAIEIGQKITGTGVMEFRDIAYGLFGFLLMFGIYILARGVWRLFVITLKRLKKKRLNDDNEILEHDEAIEHNNIMFGDYEE